MIYLIKSGKEIIDRIDADNEEEAVNTAMELYADTEDLFIEPARTREQIQAEGAAANREMLDKIGRIQDPSVIENIFPRTTSRGELPDSPLAAIGEVGYRTLLPLLDLASLAGRSIGSAPETYDLLTGNGDIEAYSKSMQDIDGSSTGGQILRDPLTFGLMGLPGGTFLGASRLGTMGQLGEGLAPRIAESIGKGAAETAMEAGVRTLDRPVNAEENVIPMLINSLTMGLAPTARGVREKAVEGFYSKMAPTPKQVAASGDRLSQASAQDMLERGVGRGVNRGNVATKMDENLKPYTDRAGKVLDDAVNSPTFTTPYIDDLYPLVEAPRTLQAPGYVRESSIKQKLLSGSDRADKTGKYPLYNDVQKGERNAAIEAVSPALDYLRNRGVDPTDLLTDLRVGSGKQHSLGDLYAMRKNLDRMLDERGGYDKSVKDLGDQNTVLREARQLLNERINTELKTLNPSVASALGQLDKKQATIDALTAGMTPSQKAQIRTALLRDQLSKAEQQGQQYMDAQSEFAKIMPWRDLIDERAPRLANQQEIGLLRLQGDKKPMGKAIVTGAPLKAYEPSLSVGESQKLYDDLTNIGMIRNPFSDAPIDKGGQYLDTPLMGTPSKAVRAAGREVLADDEDQPKKAEMLVKGGSAPVEMPLTTKIWNSLQELLDSK